MPRLVSACRLDVYPQLALTDGWDGIINPTPLLPLATAGKKLLKYSTLEKRFDTKTHAFPEMMILQGSVMKFPIFMNRFEHESREEQKKCDSCPLPISTSS